MSLDNSDALLDLTSCLNTLAQLKTLLKSCYNYVDLAPGNGLSIKSIIFKLMSSPKSRNGIINKMNEKTPIPNESKHHYFSSSRPQYYQTSNVLDYYY